MEDKKNNMESEAKVVGRDLPVSTKQSIEVCNFIRTRNLIKIKALLNKVLDKKVAIPFKRFNMDTGHKPGMASGKYPEKTTTVFLKLLDSLEKNAGNKNMDINKIFISHASANKGPTSWHFGRKRRRHVKSTHIEIRAKEKK